MHRLRRFSVAEQAAALLREELAQGRWRETMPGVAKLAEDLDVSLLTAQAALRQLEREGLLDSRGRGRSRTITQRQPSRQTLRVGILLFDTLLDEQHAVLQVLLQLQHDLEAAGNQVFFSKKSQSQLNFKVQRITNLVNADPADAWIVVAGSRELLEWFAGQTVHCLALFGRASGLPLAQVGLNVVPGYVAATRQLLALGHRRIVLIVRSTQRTPTPGRVAKALLAELAAHQVKTGDYNVPAWEETPAGYLTLLESLFRFTPPTALIIDGTSLVIAATGFFAQHQIAMPKQVSMVSADFDPSFAWIQPTLAHLRWDSAPIIRRVVRWVEAVKKGRGDREAITHPAIFIPGGSIGPAPAEP